MKDYRPLLSNVANLLDDITERWTRTEPIADALLGWSFEDVSALANDVTDMFNEIDMEIEGGERF